MNLKKLRTKLGLTQVELAKLLKTSQPQISYWENHGAPAYFESLAKMYLERLENKNCNISHSDDSLPKTSTKGVRMIPEPNPDNSDPKRPKPPKEVEEGNG